MLKKRVVPAVLAKSEDELEHQINVLGNLTDLIQIDYVDGKLIPIETYCQPTMLTNLKFPAAFEVHLMTKNPVIYVEAWHQAGATRVIGHVEAMENQRVFIEKVTYFKLSPGLAIQVDTPVEAIEADLIPELDTILIMGHRIGIQGAEFEDSALEKIARLRKKYPELNIEIDGGVNSDNIAQINEAGANFFVVGSGLLQSPDPRKEFFHLIELIK
jgi:ribulose-phosphate 3-epimerase